MANTDIQKTKLHMGKYYAALALIWLLYALLTFFEPNNPAVSRYHLSLLQLNLLRVTVLIPYLFIWFAGLFAAVRFRHYARLISGSPESNGFNKMATGVWILFWVMVLPPFITMISAYYPYSFVIQKATVIASNYVTVFLYLIGFYYLLRALESLNAAAQIPNNISGSRILPVMIMVIVLGFAYAFFVFNNHYRTNSADPLVRPTYFLPDWLIVLTILIPYLIIWISGSLAIINARNFAQNVKGIIYRRAFFYVSNGLVTIISLLIILQLLSQAGAYFGHVSIRPILLIVYVLLIAIAFAYLSIARGAKELAAIEEA